VKNQRNRVCPVELAGGLESKIRRIIHNPHKILLPYIKEGMTVLEVGCGPGFFTLEIANMVGQHGKIIAADLQDGMLNKVFNKIKGTQLQERIILHKCKNTEIGVSSKIADFVFLFYMVHEVPNKDSFFREIAVSLKSDGLVFIVEPPFHVSKSDFQTTLDLANMHGLKMIHRPKRFFEKAAILKKVPLPAFVWVDTTCCV